MSRLYCSWCDSFVPRDEVWSLASPVCPECAEPLKEVEPPRVHFVNAGDVPFQAAVPVYSGADTATVPLVGVPLASPSVAPYAPGCFTRRQVGER